MDIKAIAKPIRFRIVSGGVECASLDDLRANFDLKSIKETINDGRLVKWLNYIKENDLAEKVRNVGTFDFSDKNRDKYLELLSLLTGIDYSRGNKSDVEYIEFLDNDKNTSTFAIDLIKELMDRDVEVFLYAYRNYKELISDERKYFEAFKSSSNRDFIWEYGNVLVYSHEIEKGLGYIKEAANRGHEEAQEFIKSNKISEIKEKKYGISKDRIPEIQRIIENCLPPSSHIRCTEYRYDEKFYMLVSSAEYSKAERDVFRLCSALCKLYYCSRISEIQKCMKDTKKDFNLMNKVFSFLCLYAFEQNTSREESMKQYLELEYEPATQRAKYIESTCSHTINNRTMVLVTTQNKEIKMVDTPKRNKFVDFVWEFLRNLFNFKE